MSDKLKFIGGTNPGSKYLVIAQDGDVALAIRAFVEAIGGKVIFGLRIRKEYLKADTAGDPTEVKKFTASKFPSFNMPMKSYKHGSIATGLPVKGSFKDYEKLLEFVNDGPVVPGMVGAIKQLQGDVHFTVSEATIGDYIRQAYRDDIAAQSASVITAQKQAEKEGKVSPEDYSPEDLQKTGFDVTTYMKQLLQKPGPAPEGEPGDDLPF